MEAGYNSKVEIRVWMMAMLNKAELSYVERGRLLGIGKAIIDDGGWRGTVSEAFQKEGYTSVELPDLYV